MARLHLTRPDCCQPRCNGTADPAAVLLRTLCGLLAQLKALLAALPPDPARPGHMPTADTAERLAPTLNSAARRVVSCMGWPAWGRPAPPVRASPRALALPMLCWPGQGGGCYPDSPYPGGTTTPTGSLCPLGPLHGSPAGRPTHAPHGSALQPSRNGGDIGSSAARWVHAHTVEHSMGQYLQRDAVALDGQRGGGRGWPWHCRQPALPLRLVAMGPGREPWRSPRPLLQKAAPRRGGAGPGIGRRRLTWHPAAAGGAGAGRGA